MSETCEEKDWTQAELTELLKQLNVCTYSGMLSLLQPLWDRHNQQIEELEQQLSDWMSV